MHSRQRAQLSAFHRLVPTLVPEAVGFAFPSGTMKKKEGFLFLVPGLLFHQWVAAAAAARVTDATNLARDEQSV